MIRTTGDIGRDLARNQVEIVEGGQTIFWLIVFLGTVLALAEKKLL
jgi:hypothetical protein